MVTDTEQDINIKDLVLEQMEKPNLAFDPAKEVGPNEWEGLKQTALREQNDTILISYQRYGKLARIIFATQALFPEREGEIPLVDELEQRMNKQMIEEDGDKAGFFFGTLNHHYYLSLALMEQKFGLDPRDLPYYLQRAQAYNIFPRSTTGATGGDIMRFTTVFALAKLFPEKQNQLRRPSDRFEDYNQRFEQYKSSANIEDKLNLVYIVPLMKLLFPERALEINIDDIPWPEVREAAIGRKYDLSEFIFTQMAVKLTQAEGFTITKTGIEIFGSALTTRVDNTEPIPETRSF